MPNHQPSKLEAELVALVGQTLVGLPPAEQAGLLADQVLHPVMLALLRCGVRPWVLINALRSLVSQVPRADDPIKVADVLRARWTNPWCRGSRR